MKWPREGFLQHTQANRASTAAGDRKPDGVQSSALTEATPLTRPHLTPLCLAVACLAPPGAAVAATKPDTVVAVRFSCDPKEAKDGPREAMEVLKDYRRFSEVSFTGNRSYSCHMSGDYQFGAVLQALRERLGAALSAVSGGEVQPRFLAIYLSGPEEGVQYRDVTKVKIDLDGCTQAAAGGTWACGASVRAWYFTPGLKSEKVYYDLVVYATQDESLATEERPFLPTLSADQIQDRHVAPLDLYGLFAAP